MDALDMAMQWLQDRGATDETVQTHRLAPLFIEEAAWRLQVLRDLQSVHVAFASVAHVFLKGIALSSLLYGDPTRRIGRDIDVWVQNFDGAAQRLAAHSWTRTYSWDASAPQIRYACNADIWMRGRTQLELHWVPLGQDRIPAPLVEKMWEQCEHVRVEGTPLATPSGPSGLLYVIVHGTGSRWARLHWLCDAAQWIEQHPDDVGPMLGLAKRVGVLDQVALTDALLQRVFGAGVPGLDRGKEAALLEWADRIETGWLSMQGWSDWQDLRFNIALHGRWKTLKDRFLVPSGLTHQAVRLPRPLHFLYYPVHWFRMLARLILGPKRFKRLQ